MNELFVRCDCGSCEHQMILTRDEENDFVYVEFHLLNYDSLWKRIVAAVRYIFGHRSRYGNWDTVVLDRETRLNVVKFLLEQDFAEDACISSTEHGTTTVIAIRNLGRNEPIINMAYTGQKQDDGSSRTND